MKYCKSGSHYVVRIDRGEEVMEQLTKFCRQENILSAGVYGIGAADRVVIGLYSVANRQYHKTELTGEMEITSLVGNISQKDQKPYLHLHINVCNQEMKILGGHLNECRISATCELIVTPGEGGIGRELDSQTGLNLYQF
ncbi:MAG: PPC domain-containing DNA-binding protein [Clostridia bacterium]|nr:PPC domain-containing DNA-binding protein [Clostridia bacterium]